VTGDAVVAVLCHRESVIAALVDENRKLRALLHAERLARMRDADEARHAAFCATGDALALAHDRWMRKGKKVEP
jgi:hypothetical protein